MGSANVLKILLEIKINANLVAKTASNMIKSNAFSAGRLSNWLIISAVVRLIPSLAVDHAENVDKISCS